MAASIQALALLRWHRHVLLPPFFVYPRPIARGESKSIEGETGQRSVSDVFLVSLILILSSSCPSFFRHGSYDSGKRIVSLTQSKNEEPLQFTPEYHQLHTLRPSPHSSVPLISCVSGRSDVSSTPVPLWDGRKLRSKLSADPRKLRLFVGGNTTESSQRSCSISTST